MTKIAFLVTENMVRYDNYRIIRCFDLKGSSYGRETNITEKEKKEGTGMKCLKDKNFIDIYQTIISLDPKDRIDMID